ncbi:glycine cleavage system protein GcvH [candidate division KSB1 bacterium]|nr:glycine cleavage system protein GcvH [candidate division KSB1 bacterium]
MNVPENLHYTEEHEWISVSDNIITVGITDYAQGELGDVVYVELPEEGEEFAQMDTFGTIEAVKAVSDLFSPVSGKVVKINSALADSPEIINKDPYGDGWMIQIELENKSELDQLLNAEQYKEKIS